MATFKDLGFSPTLLESIEEAGYVTPTPIQQKSIPFIFMNRDILASAQTGTGKTASFALPIIDILADNTSKAKMPRCIVLEPTRELAQQVAENFKKYMAHSKLSLTVLIGGTSIVLQEKSIQHTDIIVATPGRLLDIIKRGTLLLNDVRVLVIDEADRMLDMGFSPDIERVVTQIPTVPQTILFSATFSQSIEELATTFLRNPKRILVSPTSNTITQYMVRVEANRKYDSLLHLLEKEDIQNGIIFCNRKRDVETLHKKLEKDNHYAALLHGDMQQSKRLQYFEKFRSGSVKFLVCSDIAARGLDIDCVSHIFNYDVPIQVEDYVHRIGRTGRAGRLGTAFTLVSQAEKASWDAIVAFTKKPVKTYMYKQSSNQHKTPAHTHGKNTPVTPYCNKQGQRSKPYGAIPEQESHRIFGKQKHIPAFLKKTYHT